MPPSQVLSVIAQQLLQLFSAKRELTSYNAVCSVMTIRTSIST